MSMQDRLDYLDTQSAIASYLRRQIVLTQAEIAYYDRAQTHGNYMLITADHRVMVRGHAGVRGLAEMVDLNQTYIGCITQKDATRILTAWNATASAEDQVKWSTRDVEVGRLLRRQQTKLRNVEAVIASNGDVQFDGSPSAQQFEADHRDL
jgi:hypothetical protein